MSSQSAVNLQEVGKLIAKAKTLARRYRELTGRPIGITGEVAEYEAARLLGLDLADARQAGYDAIRRMGKVEEHLQIKGRCILTNNPGQRLGKIDLKHQWDAVLLVLLDVDFEPTAIYEAKREAIEVALKAPGSKASSGSMPMAASCGRMGWPPAKLWEKFRKPICVPRRENPTPNWKGPAVCWAFTSFPMGG